MSIYNIETMKNLLGNNTYPGRGIVIGKSEDGKNAVFAYFIMGRSENSRNRVFVENGDEVTIYPHDSTKVTDPSLIIYSPVRHIDNKWIVTNGNQTDTIFDGLQAGLSFEKSLTARCFEPDAPNFTPRISGILNMGAGCFDYQMSILKSADSEGTACNRFAFSYSPLNGLGHFIHTYNCDGNPIPTFTGEPERVKIPNDINEFAEELWENLNETNKISMYVSFVNIESGIKQNMLFNKNI